MSQFNLIGYSNSGANVLNLTCSEKGAMLMPFGVSNERPITAEAGMLRYNTTENLFEYYNGTNWLAVSQQPPSIASITPQYVQNTISDNSINIIGDNFSTNPFVQFISSVDDSVISAQSQTFNSESSITAVISNTMRDLSSLYPFSVKVTNQSSLSSTLVNALSWNEVPTFTTAQSPSIYAEIGEGTGQLTGQLDLSAVDIGGHYPLRFTSTDLSGNTSGKLTLDHSGAITGNASSLSAANYNFSAKVTDKNEGFTLGNFTFAVLGLSVITVNTISISNVETYHVDSNNDNVGGPVINGFTIVAIYDKLSSTQRGTDLNGSLSVNYNSNGSEMDYLIVAGGGATGAWYNSGGGGAGGAKTSYTTVQGTSGGGCTYPNKLSFTANTNYTVSVGAGSEGQGLDVTVDNGNNSSFGSISVSGGGHGGQNQANAGSPGNGGCGGGSRGTSSNNSNTGGSGTLCQGYDGGGNIEYTGFYASGGGGGVGAVGETSPSNTVAGDGGAGLTSYIKGNSNVLYFGGGGGGATQGTTTGSEIYGLGGKNGGSGGGGSTSAGGTGAYGGGNGNYGGGSTGSASDGGNGGRGTGGGGGSGSNVNGGEAVKRGGSGGCGILIVRIPSYHV
jgi:hypothetical protein